MNLSRASVANNEDGNGILKTPNANASVHISETVQSTSSRKYMPCIRTYMYNSLQNAPFRTYSTLVYIALESTTAKFPSIFAFLMEYALKETKSTN